MAFLGLFGLLFAAIALWARSINLRACTWPKVRGNVVESFIEGWTSDSGPSPVVRYRYLVAGKTYESSQFSYHFVSGTLSYAEKVVRTYPVGSSVDVYYDPTDPNSAVLEPGKSHGWIWFFVGGLAFVAIAITISFHCFGGAIGSRCGLTLRSSGFATLTAELIR